MGITPPRRLSRLLPWKFLPPRALRLILRVGAILLLLYLACVLYLRHLCLLGGYPGIYGGSCWHKSAYVSDGLETYDRETPNPVPSVHVVVATTTAEQRQGQTAWLTRENLAGLLGLPPDKVEVKKYVADDPTAEYHPATNKGHETSAYLTYLKTHYDELPDVSIFMHAGEYPWHTEPLLLGSMSYALGRLDLGHVLRHGYANLRVTWRGGCPDWINTTKTAKESVKKEEPLVRQAWVDNFAPRGAAHKDAPEILGVPCCNQFAVTRETARRNKRLQYERSLEWLRTTALDDYMSGRVWEHMFHYLFTGKAVECPLERKAYCSMYRICLAPDDWRAYAEAEDEDFRLRASLPDGWAVLWRPWWGWGFTRRLAALGATMKRMRERGLVRGQDAAVVAALGDMYEE